MLQLHPVRNLLDRTPNLLQMPRCGEGVCWLLPRRKELQELPVLGHRLNPPPQHGRHLLPTHIRGHPTAAAAHDRSGVKGAPSLFTQDSLGEEGRADAADDDSLTAMALFCSPLATQGSRRRAGTATGHPADNGTSTDTGGTDSIRTSTADSADGALLNGMRRSASGVLAGALAGTNGRANTMHAPDGGDTGRALTGTISISSVAPRATLTETKEPQRAPPTSPMTPSWAPSAMPSSGFRRLVPPTIAPMMPPPV